MEGVDMDAADRYLGGYGSILYCDGVWVTQTDVTAETQNCAQFGLFTVQELYFNKHGGNLKETNLFVNTNSNI